jgi:hypothetical protein
MSRRATAVTIIEKVKRRSSEINLRTFENFAVPPQEGDQDAELLDTGLQGHGLQGESALTLYSIRNL